MADRPILCTASVVRNLLDGRQTQDRRPISSPLAKCRVGDRLWVRETCRAEELSRPPQTRPATARERAALRRTEVIAIDELDGLDGIRYLADDHWQKIENTAAAGEAWSAMFHYRGRGKGGIGNHVPSIHMPRWASRLTLVVTEVRQQWLQDISEEDARAEGAPRLVYDGEAFYESSRGTHKIGFAGLWDHLYGAGSWDANPELVTLTFTVHRCNVDQMGRAAG